MLARFVLAVALLASGSGVAHAQGDTAEGAKVYRKCAVCHVVDKPQNRVGPSLLGLMGRPAGTVEGFKYSDAMKNSGIVWSAETLDAYIADPKGYIPGNKMAFAGLKKPEERADVIAYILEASAPK
jgi:cytochrome c